MGLTVRGLLDATAFLTRLRVPARPFGDHGLARAVPWFPVVGALVGGVVAAVYAASVLALPELPAAALAVAVGVVVTGALHEDGLADVADAIGGATVADRRRILHDPRHGSYGVLALVLSVTVRVAAVASLASLAAAGALVAAHAAGRTATVALMALGPMAGDGLGSRASQSVGRAATLAAVAAGTLAVVAGLQLWSVAAVALTAAVVLGIRRWARRALDGVSGDVLGACEQLTETALLLLAAAT